MGKCMRKIIGIICSVLLVLQMTLVVSCGGNGNGSGSDGSGESVSEIFSGNVSDYVDVWSTYGATKVLQNAKNNDSYHNLGGGISFSMMKNESEGSQLVLTAKRNVSSYELVGEDLKDDDGNVISKEDISIYHQKYVEITKRANAEMNPAFAVGDYIPDMLLDMDKAVEYKENAIKAGENQSVYVEVKTKSDTKAGTYKGNFTLKVNGAKVSVPVSVTVWDFGFEGKSDFKSTFLLYTWGLLHGEYDCSDEIILNYMETALKYDICIYPVGTFDYNAEDEVSTYDGFIDYVVDTYERSDAFNTIIVPVALGGDFKAYSSDGQPSGDSQSILKYLNGLLERSTPEKPYLDHVVFYVSGLDEADMRPADWAKSKNIFGVGGEIDQLYSYLSAEIKKSDAYKGFSADYQAKIVTAVENVPMVFTNVGFMSDAVGVYDSATFCPLIDNFADPIQAEKYAEAAQKYNNGNLWTYTCTGCQYPYPSFHIDDYNYGNRAAGLMYKYYNVNGFLYWQTAQYYPSAYGFDTFLDPYTMAGRSGLIWNGEGCLFYPGAKYGSKNPFPSTRLVTYRDSMEDYKMISVLENLLNEYAEKKNIEKIDVNDYLADVYASVFCNAEYYLDDSLVYAAREELARRIISLKNGVLIENKKTSVTINSFSDSASLIEKTEGSTASFSGGAADICIKSVDRGDDNKNRRYSTYVQFAVDGLTDATNLVFNVTNTTGRAIEFEVGFIDSDGMNNYAGGVYLAAGATKKANIYFNRSLNSKLSKIKYVRFYFDNVTLDANGNYALSPDVTFRLSNLSYEKRGI